MFLFQDRTIWPLWIQRVRQSVTRSFRNHLDLLLKKNVFPLLLETVFLLNIFWGTVIPFSVFLNRNKKKKKQNLFEKILFVYIIYVFTVTFDLLNVKNNYTCITYWLYFRIQNSHFWNYNMTTVIYFPKMFYAFSENFYALSPPTLLCCDILLYFFINNFNINMFLTLIYYNYFDHSIQT